MTRIMPQEIEVWYLIPALRRELARIFIEEHGLSQKKVAEILGITGAAISQYLNFKRGNEIRFSKDEIAKIKKAASEIVRNNEDVMKKIYQLSVSLRKSKVICDIHKSQDGSIENGCDICFK
ncbi:transcriptional regulator [Candidatus Pacearchaeota archaeon]|nr:transcriptional regulator [Candidatus Pacearchaeota archaeon]